MSKVFNFDIEAGGMKPGEITVMYARQTGKSVWNDYINLWSTEMAEQRKPTVTHGTMVQKNKFRCWAKVTGGRWGLEREINEWCEENFGAQSTPGYKNPRWTNKMSFGVWHFKHDSDLTLFLLRWL
jgi:hypothetical protein